MALGLDLVELPHGAPHEIPGRHALGPFCAALALRPKKLRLDCSRDRFGDLILEREHIHDIAVIALRPEGTARLGIRELNRDADVVSTAANTAGEHVAHTEAAGNLIGFNGSAPEGKGRSS